MAYSGELQWRTRAGDEIAARLGEPLTKDLTAQALRTALDPEGSWIPSVLSAADKRLSEVRRHVPDAGGLVIATDQDSARAYAKTLRAVSGEAPTVVLSDEKQGSRKIADFSAGEGRWMVAVRMVSEGVDIPRLAVGVYATTTSTPLYFAQAIGRFVRARGRGETASVFLPSVPNLLTYASELEVARDHVLGRRVTDEDDIFAAENDLLAQAQAGELASTELQNLPFEALASQAHFDRVLFDGAEFGHEGQVHVGSEEEMDFLGIPGLLEPDQMRQLLAQRQSDRRAKQPARPDPDVPEADHPRAARRAAPRAQRTGLRLAPPHRPGARRHPRSAAQGVRWPGRRGRQRRHAAQADRPAARVGGNAQDVLVSLGRALLQDRAARVVRRDDAALDDVLLRGGSREPDHGVAALDVRLGHAAVDLQRDPVHVVGDLHHE